MITSPPVGAILFPKAVPGGKSGRSDTNTDFEEQICAIQLGPPTLTVGPSFAGR